MNSYAAAWAIDDHRLAPTGSHGATSSRPKCDWTRSPTGKSQDRWSGWLSLRARKTSSSRPRASNEYGGPVMVEYRTGMGHDIHRLVPGKKLVLGGVSIPADVGFETHSDGDVLCHALIDA